MSLRCAFANCAWALRSRRLAACLHARAQVHHIDGHRQWENESYFAAVLGPYIASLGLSALPVSTAPEGGDQAPAPAEEQQQQPAAVAA